MKAKHFFSSLVRKIDIDFFKSKWQVNSPFLLPFVALIPYAFIVIVPFLFYLTKRRGKPKRLYHFVESKAVFDKIVKSRVVLSLAGGKLHTTSEMNPFLGLNADLSRNEFYVLAISDHDDIKQFQPIFNLTRVFHAYKWWKHLRKEYTYHKTEDISFQLKNGRTHTEKMVVDGVERTFEIAYIENLKPLKNVKLIQKAQKLTFWIGEVVLSILVFYVPMFILWPPLNYWFFAKVNEWLPSEKMTIENVTPWVCLVLIVIEVLLIGLIFLHRYLRNGVIKSRE